MIWSAYLGLPLSLAGVGSVLGLEEQKLKEGKDLNLSIEDFDNEANLKESLELFKIKEDKK